MQSGQIYRDIEQGTEAWRLMRLGKVTASKIADILSNGKNGAELAGRKNYRAQLASERLSGKFEESYTNAAMQWGIDQEPFARAVYEYSTMRQVEQVAFVDHPTIEMAGCSPDGLIGEDGLIEIKCPITNTHMDYFISGEVPTQYKPQMAFQMACTGRQWCDFVSYDPRLPEEYQIFIVRYHRDQEFINQIEAAVIEFQKTVSQRVADMQEAARRYKYI